MSRISWDSISIDNIYAASSYSVRIVMIFVFSNLSIFFICLSVKVSLATDPIQFPNLGKLHLSPRMNLDYFKLELKNNNLQLMVQKWNKKIITRILLSRWHFKINFMVQLKNYLALFNTKKRDNASEKYIKNILQDLNHNFQLIFNF